MSIQMFTLLGRIIEILSRTPGQNAWQLATALGLPKSQHDVPRLADGTFSSRERHTGYDLVQRTMRAAERNGDVVSAKTLDGKRVYFNAPDVVAVAA